MSQEIINQDAENNKLWAAISYLWICFLFTLIFRKRSKFAQFHAKQGLTLFLISFATIVPGPGTAMGFILGIVAIIAIVKIYSGEYYWKIPLVYELSKIISNKIKF